MDARANPLWASTFLPRCRARERARRSLMCRPSACLHNQHLDSTLAYQANSTCHLMPASGQFNGSAKFKLHTNTLATVLLFDELARFSTKCLLLNAANARAPPQFLCLPLPTGEEVSPSSRTPSTMSSVCAHLLPHSLCPLSFALLDHCSNAHSG